MKALVYTEPERIELRELAEPEPGPTEVVVKVDAVGICGSDMHAFMGHDPRRVPPLVLGHEVAGTVEDGPRAGERVVLNPLSTCGHCDDCRSGRANLCAQRDLIGMYRPGAFAEQVVIPERNLITIPDGMDPALAALTEPAATAIHAVNLGARISHRPLIECSALVMGGGSVGLFAALALAAQGVRDIRLAETNALRRNTAAATGVCRPFDPVSEPAPSSAFAIVIDAVGSAATRTAASATVRPGGVIVHIGLQDNDGGLDTRRLTLQEVTFIGTYTYTHVDLRAALTQLHHGVLGNLDWLERRSLAAGPAAFDDLLHGRSAAPKIMLMP